MFSKIWQSIFGKSGDEPKKQSDFKKSTKNRPKQSDSLATSSEVQAQLDELNDRTVFLRSEEHTSELQSQ